MRPMSDDDFMRLALAEAQRAAEAGEVPVGAVVVRNGEVIATGRNQPIAGHDPTAHAEIVALRSAAQRLGNYRLDGCDLYVTLEPCPMCTGALLHARVRRVVYGARDPKTGAAGSVVDLFGQARLNHQTTVTGGVQAQACGQLLFAFFQHRRLQHKATASPLREDALRTPEARFAHLPDAPWPPHYVADLPSLAGLRLHYLDEGPADASRTWLCLHDVPGWSHDFRHVLPVFLAAGDRVVVPDLIGFGRSDKPKREAAHRSAWHRQVLLELVERLDLQHIVLVLAGRAADLGRTLPMAAPSRYLGLLRIDRVPTTGGAGTPPGAQAPFPDRGHQAALRAFADGWPAPHELEALAGPAEHFWQSGWQGRTLALAATDATRCADDAAWAAQACRHFAFPPPHPPATT